jgi:phosphopantetheine adenylyltransferase|tara:strand:+ start:1332 stop:1745 length:414 start_codon:yes stop_codon:yes gene_type:complete
MVFDFKKPTVQMLGRWQPWHAGHTALFEKAISKTGQVVILIRDVQGIDDNPFSMDNVATNIRKALKQAGYTHDKEYTIIKVPNIIEIAYGRNVGYSFIEYDLGEEVHKISATKIRKEMREQGSIKYIDMKHEDWPEG